MDERASVAQLKETVRGFCEEREWDPFHNPKDLAIGISTEAAEILEHFRFRSPEECESALADPAERLAIESELADVLFFVFRFAGKFQVDLSEAVERKLALNAQRYPVAKAHGRRCKYTEL